MRTLWAVMFCLPVAFTGCTGSDTPQPVEPIAAPGPTDEATAAPVQGEASPTDSPDQERPDEGVPSASETETLGELTDPAATGSGDTTPPPPDSAFSESGSGDVGMTSADTSPKETVKRYVNTTKLNVRSRPSRKAPIVGQLKKGDQVDAEITGKYAKIGDGQWVSAKHLTSKAKGSKGKKAKAKKAKARRSKKKPAPTVAPETMEATP